MELYSGALHSDVSHSNVGARWWIQTIFSALNVPEDSRLAIGLEKAEQERQKQKEEMRKLTIEMANRQHLEEVQQEALGKF